MKYNALHDAGRFSRLRRNRKRWQKVVSVMASIVVFCTTYALILPAITAESQDLSNVQLICNQAEHSHGAECSVIERGELICQTPTEPAHTHGDACYAVEVVTETSTVEVLTCTSEEEGHQHDSSCYTAEERTTEKEVSKLICTEDTSAHEHGDSCYAQIVKQICTLEEHIHGAGCYEAKDEIKLPEQPQQPVESEQPVEPEAPVEPEQPVEGQEPEVPVEPEHVHDETCIQAEDGTWSCETPVVEPEQPVEPEVPAHQHEDVCYDENGQLICEIAAEEEVQPEIPVLPEVEEPEIDEDVICEMYEHEHYELCYDANGEIICPLYEHEHDETCYPEEELFVALPEGAQVPETHSETYMNAAEADEEGNIPYSVAVYTEPGSLPEGARLAVELLEDEAYTAAGEQLAEQGITPSGYIAFDIHFEAPSHVHSQDLCYDEEGNLDCAEEIVWEEYPIDSTVYVSINAKNMLPEGIDEQSVQVHHHAETDMNILDKAVALFTGEPEVVIETVVDQLLNMEAEIAPEMNLIETFVSELDETMLDVNAAFEVNGFSTFTVTWETSGASVDVYYVDVAGNQLVGNQKNNVNNTTTGIVIKNNTAWVQEIAGNEYLRASINTSDTENANYKEVTAIRYVDGVGFQYALLNDQTAYPAEADWATWTLPEGIKDYRVFLIYQNSERTVVDTVDTTSLGVTIDMFNYTSGQINSNRTFQFPTNTMNSGVGINQWTGDEGGVNQGILAPKLYNGYPVLSDDNDTDLSDNESLAYLFNPSTTVSGAAKYSNANYLFQKDAEGNYYYDSTKNFAEFNTSTKQFTVYNEPTNQNAKFMPYDGIDDNTGYGWFGWQGDFHFGMSVSTPFMMPKNGEVNGSDMLFEFNGDDDLWVFVDGVLVLDMGGIHGAGYGSINFATGATYIDAVNSGRAGQSTSQTITNFYNIIAENSDPEWVAANMIQDANGNYTFRDYSQHTMQVYYLERGQNESNCMIRFNLPVVQKNSLMVGKELGTNAPTANMQEYVNNLDFYYRVMAENAPVNSEKDSDLYLANTVTYDVYDIDDMTVPVSRGNTVGEYGIFTLKGNQIAVFAEAYEEDDTAKYYVQELIPGDYRAQYEGVIINGTSATSTEQEATVGGNTYKSFVTGSLNPSEKNNSVVFSNVINWDLISMLEVSKNVVVGDTAQRNALYDIYVEIGGKPLAENTKYVVGTDNRTVQDEGIIQLSHGETAEFPILAGTSYKVYETKLKTDCTVNYTGKAEKYVLDAQNKPTGEMTATTTMSVEADKVTGAIDEVYSIHSVTVNNTFPAKESTLKLEKTVAHTGGETVTNTTEFTFKLTIPAENAGKYTLAYSGAETGVARPGTVEFVVDETDTTIATATIGLRHQEICTVTLPIGINVTVQEVDHDGYSVKWQDASDALVANGDVTNVTIAETETYRECVNTTGYALPSTGGIGTTLYTMSGMAMMSAALVGGYGLRRKRERGSEE